MRARAEGGKHPEEGKLVMGWKYFPGLLAGEAALASAMAELDSAYEAVYSGVSEVRACSGSAVAPCGFRWCPSNMPGSPALCCASHTGHQGSADNLPGAKERTMLDWCCDPKAACWGADGRAALCGEQGAERQGRQQRGHAADGPLPGWHARAQRRVCGPPADQSINGGSSTSPPCSTAF